MWGALSDERTGLSFTIAAGPRQRSHSRFRVSWDWRPHFTVPDSSQSQSHIATDGQSVGQSVSKFGCRASSGAQDQIFITLWQLRSCFCEAHSLTRRRFYFLYTLLALASVVFLGSGSLGSRNHILLSQIWDSPFHRLLRLAESRWRYSNPASTRVCPGLIWSVSVCKEMFVDHSYPWKCVP
jgi:hypothetical protein